MRAECVQAVATALGRSITQQEAKNIEERVTQAARALARQDPQAWLGKSQADRLTEAGQYAAQQLLGEAQLKQKRAALQVAAGARLAQQVADAQARGLTAIEAVERLLAVHTDARMNVQSVETTSKAISRDALRQMIDTLTASNPKWFGLFENKDGITALVREIFGESSGNADARAGAEAWRNVSSALRERFNRSGGDIGLLDDWGMPHHHSQLRVAKAGREAWVAEVLPRLKREAYVNPDGTRMTDAQLGEFLGEAWLTIATGGANKLAPGQPKGNGMRANRGNASRQIHFKSADDYLAYQENFGERSLYEVLTGHVEGVSKDIALVEAFGPNPDAAFRLLRDQAVQSATVASPTKAGRIRKDAIRAENLYNYVAGRTLPVANEALARGFDTLRNWLTASRLGSAVISSLSDEATLYLTAHVNNLPELQVFRNELAALNPANKVEERMANRAGLALNTMIATLNRFGQDSLGASFSSKLAGTVMRVQGLNAITEARRRAFGVTMMGSLGAVVREHPNLAALDPGDNRILLSKGISETDFGIWKRAQLEDWGNGNDTMLTPEAIYRIPDADIDAVIAPRIADIRAQAQAAADDLLGRNVEEQGWIADRAQKLRDAQDAANRAVKDFAGRKEAKASQAADALRTRAELLQAEIERAQVRADIDAYLAQARTREQMQQYLDEVEEGAAADRVGQRAARTGDAASRRRGSIGEKLGQKQGNLERRIVELEARVRKVDRETQALITERAKAADEKIAAMRAELGDFAKRSQERQARRQQVVDRLRRDVDPAIAAARQQAREQAATKLLGAVLEETDIAVIEPGARERALMGSGLQRGTWKGELARSFFLFKSFPLAMIFRHWTRGMSMQTGTGKAAYLATLLATTTVLGAMTMQVRELLAGRDPRNLNPAAEGSGKNWMKAMLQGGSLGLYGDFLFSEATQSGRSLLASALGPVAGLADEVAAFTQGNVIQAAQGKDTNAGAEAVKLLRGNLPGASLWYSKAALDHLIFHRLQEYFSPGYLAQMRARAQREFGQSYYWEPGETLPDRAPDLGAITGE